MPPQDAKCLNCEHVSPGANFCPECGQRLNLRKRSTVAELFVDALQNLSQIDGKLILTLRTLLLEPGKLSREHFLGRRVRYLSPVTLFMLIAGILFLGIEWNAAQPIDTSSVVERQGNILILHLMPGFRLAFPEGDRELVSLSDQEAEAYLDELSTDRGTWNYFILERSLTLLREDGVHEFRQGLARITYRSVALLIPMMAILVLWFHYGRTIYFAEAAIYCLHLHCVLFLVGLVLLLLPDGFWRATGLFLFMPPMLFYMAQSLRVAFANTWPLAIIKAVSILMIHSLAVLVLAGLLSLWVILTI